MKASNLKENTKDLKKMKKENISQGNSVFLFVLFLMTASCSIYKMPKIVNCKKNGLKNGYWFQRDTINKSTILYRYTKYNNGIKSGPYYEFIEFYGPGDSCNNVIYKETVGHYVNDKKKGLWLYYITGHFLSWKYYTKSGIIHDIHKESIYLLEPCSCF